MEDLVQPDSLHKRLKKEPSHKASSSSDNPKKALALPPSKASSDKGEKLNGKGEKPGGQAAGRGKREESGEGAEQDKRGVADLVVKYLTPHYKAGRFANKVSPALR